MNRFKLALIVIINVLLQASIFSRINIYGGGANLSLPIIVAISMMTGQIQASYTSLTIGLSEDIAFGGILGIRALVYFIFAFLISKMARSEKFNKFYGMLTVFTLSILSFISISLIEILMGKSVNIFKYLMGPLFFEALFNSVLFLLVYRILMLGKDSRRRLI